MFSFSRLAAVLLAVAASAAAQTCSTSPQPYNTVPGYPRSDGCVPSGYTSAYDLGNTSPTDAQTRCQQQCNQQANCAGYVAQLNKSPNGLYSGTCFFYAGSVPKTVRQCADKPTQLVAESKDFTLQCFSSPASSAAATAFCSSYLNIGTVTTYTSTSTPTTTTSTTSISTIVTTTTLVTSTATTSATTSIIFQKRAVSPTPACVTSDTPASRLSSACSCLNIKSTTQSLLSTAATKTSVSVIQSTITTTTTVNTVTTTTAVTSVTPTFSTLARPFTLFFNQNQQSIAIDSNNALQNGGDSAAVFTLTNGVLAQQSTGFSVATKSSNAALVESAATLTTTGDTVANCYVQGHLLHCNGASTNFYGCLGGSGSALTIGFGSGFSVCGSLGLPSVVFV